MAKITKENYELLNKKLEKAQKELSIALFSITTSKIAVDKTRSNLRKIYENK